jgi:D-beta-D-heptose 7-phosphate kinase/D-beta-D-heptose 1-phosphate adenosyltransferase
MVFTNGCFDLLHWGHLRYLQTASGLGDYLVVGLNSDSSVELLKGETRPLFAQEHRAELLAALTCVDYVTIFSEPTARELVAVLKPEVYVKGGDYADPKLLPEAEEVLKYGGEIRLMPHAEGISTSILISAISQGKGRL